MGRKGKYASWEKVAKAVEAAEQERAARRESSRPPAKSASSQPRWAPSDPLENLKRKLAKHKARREAAMSIEPVMPVPVASGDVESK